MKGTRRSEEQIITFGARLWCETESMESTNGGLHPQFSDGHSEIGAAVLLRLARKSGKTIEWLLTGNDQP